jgi:hypothetical protein
VKAKFVYEKFEQESDPVKDMRIGQARFKHILLDLIPDKAPILYGQYHDVANFLKTTIEDDRIAVRINIFKSDQDRKNMMYIFGGPVWLKAFADDLKSCANLYIKSIRDVQYSSEDNSVTVIFDHALNESVNEKFEDESDPIEDMGIGHNHKKIFKNLVPGVLLRVARKLQFDYGDKEIWPVGTIIEITRVTDHSDSTVSFYYDLYNNKYDFNRRKAEAVGSNWQMSFGFFKKYFEKITTVELDEAFTDQSDPVADMGIGIHQIYKNIKKGDIFRFKKRLDIQFSDPHRFYPKGGYVRIDTVSPEAMNDRILIKYSYFTDKANLKNNKHKTASTWRWDYDFFKEFFEPVSRKELYEAFSEESDPIEDMGIGFFKVHDFESKTDLNKFVAQNIEMIFMIDKLPKAFLGVKQGNGGVTIKSKNREYLNAYALKFLKLNGKTLMGNTSVDLFSLSKYLRELKKGVILIPVYDWDNKGYWLDPAIYDEVPKFLRDVNESFKEDSDPITDLGIGQINIHKNFKTYKSGYKFICKYIIPYLIGNDNIKSIINSQEVQGKKWLPIDEDVYQRIYHYVKNYLTVEGEEFDISGHDLKNYVMIDKLRESFSEESDPITDLGIGHADKFEKKYANHKLNQALSLTPLDEEYLVEAFDMPVNKLFLIGTY